MIRDMIRAAAARATVPNRRAAAGPPVGPPFAGMGRLGSLGRYGHDAGLNQEQYLHNQGYVYSIIRTIANRIIGQPVFHARKVGDGDKGKAVNKFYLPDHLKADAHNLRNYVESPILAAFRAPNPIMVRYTVMFNTVASLELTGKAFWWMRWGPGRKPEIWPLPSHWVQPVHTPSLFASWIVEPGGGAQRFSLPGNEIAYFYYPDPSDPLSAYAPLTALAKTVMADESLEESQRRTFLNTMHPGLAITIGQAAEDSPTGRETSPVLTRAQRRALKTILKDEYRGVVNSGEPMILDGFIKAVQPVFPNPKEMDYLNSGQSTKGRLSQGWGVNPISMGEIEGANRASSAVADDHLINNVVNPRISMLSEIMTRTLPPFFTGRRDEVVYIQPASSKDIDYELTRDAQMFDRGAKSINEWREGHGMPPIDNGNRAYIQGSGGGSADENGDGKPDSGAGWVDVEIDADDGRGAGKPSGSKVKDDVGHDHDQGGKFTGPGGSSGGASGSESGKDDSSDDHDDEPEEPEEADHSETHDKWSEQDDEIQERRAKEDEAADTEGDADREAHDDWHAAQTEKAEKKRDKEDAGTEKKRDKEDAEIQKKRDGLEKSRDKEDTECQKNRDKEDAEDLKRNGAVEKARGKEDAEQEKARSKEDKEREKRQNGEEKAAEKTLNNELEANDERHEGEQGEQAARHDSEKSDYEKKLDAEAVPEEARGPLRDALAARHKEEYDAMLMRQHNEDSAAQSKYDDVLSAHEDENDGVDAARDAEDEKIQADRDAADEADNTAAAKREEDRDAEDAGIEAARAKEDAELDDAESALAEQREAEDAEVAAARKKEDDELAAEEEKRSKDLDERHKADDAKTAADRAEEDTSNYKKRQKENPDAHAEFYSEEEHKRHAGEKAARAIRLKTARKVRDDVGHEHDQGGRFSGPGGSGGGSSGKPKPTAHGSVDDDDAAHAEKARSFMSKIKKAGKRAVKVAKQLGERAHQLSVEISWHVMTKNLADDICDTSHDYSKIINAKGTGDWLSAHLGVSGNIAAKVSSMVLSYAVTKLKQHVANKRRAKEDEGKVFEWYGFKADSDEDTDIKVNAVHKCVTALVSGMGCPDDQLPSKADVRKFCEERAADDDDESEDDDPDDSDDSDDEDDKAVLPEKSIAAGWGIKATARHFRDMVDAHRKELASTLSGVLAGLGAQAVREIRKYRGHDATAAVQHAIDAGKWEEAVKAAVEDALTAAAKSGAAGEWVVSHDKAEAVHWTKAGLPGRLWKAVKGLVSALLDGKTWGRLVGAIAGAARSAIGRAIKNGDDAGDAAAAVLTEPLSIGAHADRAADVEASAAVNGGRNAAYDALLQTGKVVARRWMTCRDTHVRDAHRRAHGQVARGDSPFVVGGEECRFPGDPTLSAKNRCRCRCISVSISG